MMRKNMHGKRAHTIALAYVAAVLALDTWLPPPLVLDGFDVLKFLAWLVIPVALSFPHFDWGYYGTARWRKGDWAILAGLCAAGGLALLAIPYFNSLKALYHPLAAPDSSRRLQFLIGNGLWILSWLLGWEFLLRNFALRHAEAISPRHGWWLVPAFEGVYHLQKPIPEMLAMVALSVVLTTWARRRRNGLLPFLVHLTIEVGLVLFLLV